MSSLIDEHSQYVDSAGVPLSGGSLYVGTQNLDPVANTITIYSDRALSVSISNPQTLDAKGRTTNKIWVPGKYSLQVNDSADVQHYQELDCGTDADTGVLMPTGDVAAGDAAAVGYNSASGLLLTGQGTNFDVTLKNDLDQNVLAIPTGTRDISLINGDLILDEISANRTTPLAGDGHIWVKNDTPNTLMFTDDSDADHNVLPIEGSWTPVLTDGTNDATSTLAVGAYTRIGDTVFIRCYLATSSLGSVSGAVQISGLPYAGASVSGSAGAVTVGQANSLAVTAGQVVSGIIASAAQVISLQLWDATGGTTAMSETEWTATGQIMLHGMYSV